MGDIRKIFESKLGGGALLQLRKKETALKAGLPDKSGVAFPEKCDLRDKFHELEAACQHQGECRILYPLAPTDPRTSLGCCPTIRGAKAILGWGGG